MRSTRTAASLMGMATLAALGLAAARPALAQNIVQDPSFENAAPTGYSTGPIGDGWNVTEGDISILSFPHTGSQDADLDLGFTPNGLSQMLKTTPGQSYDISYFIADDAGGDALNVTFGGQSLFSGTTPYTVGLTPGDYQQYSYTGVATGPTTDLTFVGEFTSFGGGTGTQLDDVSVTPASVSVAPEPSPVATVGIVALFAGGLMLKARKRKSSPSGASALSLP